MTIKYAVLGTIHVLFQCILNIDTDT